MELFEKQIIAHAESTPKAECCGIIVRSLEGLIAIPCPNVSPHPENSFIIALKEYAHHISAGTLHATYHSHTVADEHPSIDDLYIAQKSQVPGYVYSISSKKIHYYVPNGYEVPLIGRPFTYGIFDCVSLVDDYYFKHFGIRFPHYQRQITHMEKGIPNIVRMMEERGLTKVDPDELEVHDIIGFSLARSVNGMCNHVAIYCESDYILHQLFNRTSCTTVYGGQWKKNTAFVCRLGKI